MSVTETIIEALGTGGMIVHAFGWLFGFAVGVKRHYDLKGGRATLPEPWMDSRMDEAAFLITFGAAMMFVGLLVTRLS